MTSLQKEMLEKNTILIEGAVNLEMFEYVKDCIQTLELKGSPEINVRISSPGGCVDHGFWIYDLIRLYQGNSVALVIGQCDSMASVILQACKVRKAYKHSLMIVHDLGDSRRMTVRDYDDGSVKKKFDSLRINQDCMIAIYEKRTGKDRKEIDKLIEEDRTIYMEEAKKLGFIDEII